MSVSKESMCIIPDVSEHADDAAETGTTKASEDTIPMESFHSEGVFEKIIAEIKSALSAQHSLKVGCLFSKNEGVLNSGFFHQLRCWWSQTVPPCTVSITIATCQRSSRVA